MRVRSSVTVIKVPKVAPEYELPPLLSRFLPQEVIAMVRAAGCRRVEEIRLRVDGCCSLTDESGNNRQLSLPYAWDRERMDAFLRRLCDGSRYALTRAMDHGYICPGGGVRVGLCGMASVREGDDGNGVTALQRVDAVCIRLPGHFAAVGQGIEATVRACYPRGVLFFSPPGVGKTTLIRALAVMLSSGETPLRTVLVDSRHELDDGSFGGCRTLDILSGYPKREGIEIAVRTLGAQVILCDELGAQESHAVLSAALYGVPLIASAHALHFRQLLHRPEIRLLDAAGVFAAYVGLQRRGMGEDYAYRITMASDGRELSS